MAIYALLISPLGGPTVKLLANTFVDNLSIDAIDGGFADTLEVHHLKWENPQWKVEAQYAFIDITWRCLFEPRVCLNELTLENATLTQRSSAPADENETSPNDKLELPLPIDIGYLALSNIKLALLTTTIEIDELELVDFEGNKAEDNKKYALVKEISVGISGENYYEVKSGILEGEMIVIGGYRALSKELSHGDLVILKNQGQYKNDE